MIPHKITPAAWHHRSWMSWKRCWMRMKMIMINKTWMRINQVIQGNVVMTVGMHEDCRNLVQS